MVQSLNISSNTEALGQKKPQVVEIIGPAGAGKTTLCKELLQYQFQKGSFPNVKKIGNAPFYIRNGVQLIPLLLRLLQYTDRPLNQREFAWLAILKGWPYLLQREVRKSTKVLLLDQGPVYLMVELNETGPEFLKSHGAEKFWEELYSQWAQTLDLIVWLDTSDDRLMERIRTRKKDHLIKNDTEPEMIEFLDQCRRDFNFIVSKLEGNASRPRILKFDTAMQKPNEIAAYVLNEIGLS